jgi:hypothetical protein
MRNTYAEQNHWNYPQLRERVWSSSLWTAPVVKKRKGITDLKLRRICSGIVQPNSMTLPILGLETDFR